LVRPHHRKIDETLETVATRQASLEAERAKRTHQASEAPLAGRLFDDRGNRMSPSWAKKGSKRWRYYVSQAAFSG
jgi:hypothetical protein